MSPCLRPAPAPLAVALVITGATLLVPTDRAHANYQGFALAPAAVATKPADTGPPALTAHRNSGPPIEVDGRLDESVWNEAPAAGGFKVWSPDRGKDPSEETLFKVAYDDQAIYFAVACLERDVDNISTTLSRRDQHRDTDNVSIFMDPYHDKTTGYLFRVNPSGVQEDYVLFEDNRRDSDWNAVWEAETSLDEDGWYAEMRIPFSSISYRPGPHMTWGLQISRTMHRRGEDTAWVTWGEEESGFVSRFGELTGLEGVSSPRQLEVMPYVVQRSTDPSEEGPEDEFDQFQNIGADLKWSVTPDLTLNATIQPDFGQVEADPATLNLSPFETFFEEKRPFFVEGSRFFRHQEFNMFYSRRIGTGDENSRIRYAGKLTGKTAGNVSLAALYASTDVTQPGQAHNFLKRGERTAHYVVGRIGKDFADGRHSFHVMQTAALRSAERPEEDETGLDYRDGYTTGLEFQMNSPERTWRASGSFVGSIVDLAPVEGDESIDHAATHGTGGEVSLLKSGGRWRGSTWARWESEQLDLNDVGFLSAPDEMNSGLWMQWRYIPGENPRFNNGNVNVNLWRSWLYAGSRVEDDDSGDLLWEFGRGRQESTAGNINGWMQMRNYWNVWYGFRHSLERTDQHITRGGPLMTRPSETGGWLGFNSDWRKSISGNIEGNWTTDAAGGLFARLGVGADWTANASNSYGLEVEYWTRQERADYLDTFEHDTESLGIGGTSWVFGDLDQRTVAVTMRSNLLFDRSRSLELYMQPYLTVGDYTNARELARPDSYDLVPYAADGFQAEDRDFSYASVNMNLVYRWEYRPGSAFFLVWTHARSDWTERSETNDPNAFDNGLARGNLFDNEPENVLLAKLTYWFAL